MPVSCPTLCVDQPAPEPGPDWRAGIAAFDRAAGLAERARKAHEVCLTDLNARRAKHRKDPISEQMLRERKRAERRRAEKKALEKQGGWEGPVCQFELFLGESRSWSGPGATCIPGTSRCRSCSHIPRLSALVPTVCLDCHRSTCDHWPEVRGARPKPREQKPPAKATARKLTRKERRAG